MSKQVTLVIAGSLSEFRFWKQNNPKAGKDCVFVYDVKQIVDLSTESVKRIVKTGNWTKNSVVQEEAFWILQNEVNERNRPKEDDQTKSFGPNSRKSSIEDIFGRTEQVDV